VKAISQEQGERLKAQLRKQGTRPTRSGKQFPPGHVLSVELERCGHPRARGGVVVGLAVSAGEVPGVRSWRVTVPKTAHRPVRNATRTVVEKVEVRAGREFRRAVLATPPRARV